jgi:type IV pilus assembly protein PilN
MIKVNLTPVKRKKKAKPIPTALIIGVFVTIAALLIAGLFFYRATSKLAKTKAQHAANETRLAELKEKIKAVENFEQLNKTFEQRNKIIEQLSKKKSVPVFLLDEVSKLLPIGVWLDRMTVTGDVIKLDGYGFTNTDIVVFVDKIKASKLFVDVYLNQSKGIEMDKVPLYQFSLTFRIKV